jgi:hypothetical protein
MLGIILPNSSIQRTRAKKSLGVFKVSERCGARCRLGGALGIMKALFQFFVFAVILALCGCDNLYYQRFDIEASDGSAFNAGELFSKQLVRVLKQYADVNGLSCIVSEQLPFECYRQPVHIWAVETEKGAVVCYSAIGIPLESSKFDGRINSLKTLLNSTFPSLIIRNNTQCPRPPSFGSKNAQSAR